MEIEKKTLRLGIRKELAPPLQEEAQAIRRNLTSLDCWRNARTILAYHPLAAEIDLLSLLSEEDYRMWIFPKVDGDSLSLHRWVPDASWLTGPYGIREPDPERWPVVGVETIDLALIPALAFDRAGNRLGRGKGYYDRLLARSGFRALKIGIVTERFLLPGIPSEPHDIAMDLVVTESAVHVTPGSRLDNGGERG
jgi:5-formyltetrahydrofolate cyclo-ligase